MAWNRHVIEQTQLRRQHRVDGVGRPKFDFHAGAMYLSTAWHGARRGMDIATREAKIAEIFKQLTWLEANKVEGPCPEHKTNFVPAPVLP